MSLTSCLRKVGPLLDAEARTAVLQKASELRATGLSADDAGRQAVQQVLEATRAELAAAELLSAQTEADLRDKAEREKAGEDAARAKKAAEQRQLQKQAEDKDNRARADATVDDFQLGQSADRQMSGMGDLFDQPVAEPEASAETPQAPSLRERATRGAKPLEDAGEKIGGARKDRWAERGLNVGDLDAMSESEGALLATKANVWKPDYAAMVEAGAQPEAAAMVKVIYDSLAAKPKANTPQGRRDYVKAMQAVRQAYGTVKTADDAKNAYVKLREALGLRVPEGSGFRESKDPDARRALFSVYKGRSDPFVLYYNEIARARKLVAEGFPGTVEPWTRRFVVRSVGGEGITDRGVEIYVRDAESLGTPITADQLRAGAWRVTDKAGRVAAYAATKDDAAAAARTVYERAKASGESAREPERPHLDRIAREGLEQSIDRDVVASDFVDGFGFRGVEWGNWAAQDERQKLANLAHDGLADLARVLNVPRRALSLNGTLGMAFGARGGGRFAAHYEPGKLVINMTKLRGAGSLAHEWAHAFDHYLGEMDRKDAYQTAARGASGWYRQESYDGHPRKRMERDAEGKWRDVEAMRLPNLRPELAEKIDAVMRALFTGQQSKADMLKEMDAQIERAEARGAKDETTDAGLAAMYRRQAESFREARKEIEADPDDKTYPKGRSQFAAEAQKLSGKSESGYWLRPTEMFARAFESYVFDRIKAMGAKSEYLVHGVEPERYASGYKGNPYPTGEERAAINRAFDALVAELKTRETEGGNVAMFSIADNEQQGESDGRRDERQAFWRRVGASRLGTVQPWVNSEFGLQVAGGRRRDIAYAGSRQGSHSTGLEQLVFNDRIAGFDKHVSFAAAFEKDGETYLRMYVIPEQLIDEADVADIAKPAWREGAAVLKVALVGTKENGFEASVDTAMPGSLAYERAAPGSFAPSGQFDGKGVEYQRLKLGHAATMDYLREAVRRFGIRYGYAPSVTFRRDTGAKPGARDRTITPQEIERKFDAAGIDARTGRADTESYEPAGNADTEAAQRFAARLNTGQPRSNWVVLDAVTPRAGRAGSVGAALQAVATTAKRLFGHRVVFVRFQGRPLFNGAVDRAEPGVIFINADSQRPMMAVLGHELLHKLRNEREDLYREFVRRISRVTKNAPEYAARIEAAYKAHGREMPKDWVEELHADIVGDFFMEPQFWQDMAAEQPTLFRRLANAILKFLDDVAEHLKGVRTFGTERYLTDIAAARAAVVSAMRQFSENQTEPMADTVEGIRLSAADPTDQTETPAFRKWFGDSKVVDAEGKPLVGRELAVAMYERGASSATVAKAMGNVSVATVKRWVSDAGVQRTVSEARGGTKENRDEAARLYADGLGAFEIADRLGVSNRGVYNWLRDAGVEIRSLSEAQALRAAQGRQPIRGVRATLATKWGDIRVDSVYEAARLRQLEADPAVAQVERATKPIEWGDNQRYTPDFVVTLNDGGTRIEEVKPEFQQDRADVVAKAEAARASLQNEDADYQIITTPDLASGFQMLSGVDGITFGSEDDGGRFKRALATAKSAIGNRGTFDASNPDIRFSLADTSPEGQKRAAQDFLAARGGVFDFNRLGETKQDRVRTVIDKSRPFWLGALTRDQIADIYGAEIPQIKDYDRLTRAMENQRASMAQHAEALYEEWAKLPDDVNDRLARIMLDSTVAQVHPDHGQPPANATREQRQTHARLRLAYKLLPPEGQAMYQKVRDHHARTLDDLRSALLGRMDRLMADGKEKQAILADIRDRFDGYLGNGPYFPLSRFGDYIVVANRDDGERVVATYETAGEQQAAARALQADGFTVKLKTAKGYNRSQDGAAGKFIGDVLVAIEKADIEGNTLNGTPMDTKNQLLDEVNQLFIRALPDMSYRKHFAHRKNTPGFSADVMRGFASSAFHAASHIARLNHGDRMTAQLEEAFGAIEQAPEGDFNQSSQVLNELAARHEKMLNPDTHPLSALATQVGFVMYLGLSPAAGLINMLQVPMVALPYIGARHGFAKASAAMSKAYKDIMGAPAQAKSGFNAAESQKLSAEERQAIETLQDEGVIDLTQAHDLAAATNRDMGNQARSRAGFAMARAMRIVGWTFHVPEVMNRQVTALLAYRLERDAGASHDAALEAAREAIKRTQFDYSACVDADTEILTTSGWKRYDALAEGDTAIAVDDAGRAVHSAVEAVNVYTGEHEVIEFRSTRRFSMVVTPHHDCVIQTHNSKTNSWGRLRKVRADELKIHHYIPRSPTAAVESGAGEMGEDFAALLGWIAAEGWYAKFRNCKNATNVRLGQSLSHNAEYAAEISGILQRLGGHFTEHANKRERDTLVTFSLHRVLGKRVQEAMPDKVLTPALVESMSTAEKRAFLMAFLKGDGTENEAGAWNVAQKNGANLDLLQAMATMCGMRSTLSPVNGNGMAMLYVVTDDKGGRTHVRPLKQERRTVPLVWCPTTEHGTWIARRNGTVFATGNSNRARYMQGNVARVVLQFKQFAQNMTYFLARAAHQALKGESPEVRKIARRQLLATFAATGAMAGSMGLPGIGFFGSLIGALVGAMGDDDEPWDWKVEYRNALADAFGKEAAEVLAKGLPRALMPWWDISNRVGLSDLWWRDSGREGQNPRERFASDMGNVLGPTAGTLLGWYTAADHMQRGNYGKAVEAIVPKFIRDPLKAAREATQGVTSYTGEPLAETTAMEDIGRVLGFAPARISEMYEGRNAVMNAKTALEERRQALIGRAAKARMEQDAEAVAELQDEIAAFNSRNPEFRITGATIAKSVMTRKRNRANTEDGIMLPDTKDGLRERGRFAVTQ